MKKIYWKKNIVYNYKKKVGGLIKGLDWRMNKLKSISSFYENKITTIENDNSKLNVQWEESFNEDWIEKYEFKDILDFQYMLVFL